MSTSMIPELRSMSFWRVVDVPFETFVATLDSWLRTKHAGELRFGGSQFLGSMEHDRDVGTTDPGPPEPGTIAPAAELTWAARG
jgi:hypothetical protein